MARSAEEPESSQTRTLIARAFTLVEDVVYIGIGTLLALSAAMLLVNGAIGLWRASMQGAPPPAGSWWSPPSSSSPARTGTRSNFATECWRSRSSR